jgi:hypothetical protein
MMDSALTKTAEEEAEEALRRVQAPMRWAIYDRRNKQLDAPPGYPSHHSSAISPQDEQLLDDLRRAAEYVSKRDKDMREAPYAQRIEAIAVALAEMDTIVGKLIKKPHLRSHPAVQERLVVLRTLEPAKAMRKYKNDRIGALGRRSFENGGYITTWVTENAQGMLDAGHGPEAVRLELRRLAKEQWKGDSFNDLRKGSCWR